MDSLSLKTCTKCKIEKPRAEFSKQTRRNDGLHPWCKACFKNYDQARDAAKRGGPSTRTYPLKSQKPGHKICAQCLLEKPVSDFYANVKLKSGIGAYCKPCAKMRSKRNYNGNCEAIRAQRRQYRHNNREHICARVKAWRKANPEARLAQDRRRRARARNGEGTHTAADVARQFEAQKGRCWWCPTKLKKFGKGKFHRSAARKPIPFKGGMNCEPRR